MSIINFEISDHKFSNTLPVKIDLRKSNPPKKIIKPKITTICINIFFLEINLIDKMKPILGCDVWEHSYYIDYRNRRPEYLDKFIDKLVNWEFVEAQLD